MPQWNYKLIYQCCWVENGYLEKNNQTQILYHYYSHNKCSTTILRSYQCQTLHSGESITHNIVQKGNVTGPDQIYVLNFRTSFPFQSFTIDFIQMICMLNMQGNIWAVQTWQYKEVVLQTVYHATILRSLFTWENINIDKPWAIFLLQTCYVSLTSARFYPNSNHIGFDL